MRETVADASDEFLNYLGINKGYDLEAKGKTDEYITAKVFEKEDDIYGVFQGVYIARYHRYLLDKAAEFYLIRKII